MWTAGKLKITDEQIEIALKNGLSRDRVRNRVKNLYWDVERAISTPIRPKPITVHTEHDIDEAKKKGIGFNTFYGRVVTLQWSVDRAKNEPPRRQDGVKKKKGDRYAMDWNKRINGLQKELGSLKPNCEAAILLRRKIKRLEINAKDFNES